MNGVRTRVSTDSDVTAARRRVLRAVAVGCLVIFIASVVMVVVGDPIWNLYVVSFGLFVAPPVGVVAGGLLLLSRRGSAAGPA
jgi:hypothetical protein